MGDRPGTKEKTQTLGTADSESLRHCATSRKVAGSIPDGKIKGNAIPLQVWAGSEGSRRFRLPDSMTLST